MTGKDLIVYILTNGLEDEQVIDENGVIIGFMTIEDAAVKYEVGVSTVRVWINDGLIKGIKLAENILIPKTEKRPEF